MFKDPVCNMMGTKRRQCMSLKLAGKKFPCALLHARHSLTEIQVNMYNEAEHSNFF